MSFANNLVAGDGNGAWDIFVRDLNQGTTERVSVSSSGTEGNAISDLPAISGDGRYVAFYSPADNLVAGDSNGTWDVFVRDRQRGLTARVNVAPINVEGDAATLRPAISADGAFIAFPTDATNLSKNDGNGTRDVLIAPNPLAL